VTAQIPHVKKAQALLDDTVRKYAGYPQHVLVIAHVEEIPKCSGRMNIHSSNEIRATTS